MTTVNDASITGAYVSYTVDRAVRSAGTGFTQSWRQAFGCPLLAASGGTQILPRASAFPAPFAGVPQTVRLAPVVVFAGAGNGGTDVLGVQAGASGLGEAAQQVLPGSPTASSLRVPATIGMRGGDLVVVIQDGGTCMLQQVATGFVGAADQLLSFGGTYASATINGVSLAVLGSTAITRVVSIGNVAGNQPLFQLIGIDTNATLVSLDVLQLGGGDIKLPIADGVADLRFVYGVDTDDDGRIDAWRSPGTAPFDSASLLDGSATAQANLSRILALRVGVIVRTSAAERNAVTGSTLTLFSDLGTDLTYTRTLTSGEQKLRWRSLEFTVPLRNVMLKP
jgi:type IV pilus assembly protein PilW